MASTGTRLRWQSYRPLIRCRLPGPQLPAQTARRSVRCASAPAANAAVSSCLTCTQRSLSCRRMESVIPLRESPETPYILATPRATKVSTSTSATAFLPIACPPSSRSERRGEFDRVRTLVDGTPTQVGCCGRAGPRRIVQSVGSGSALGHGTPPCEGPRLAGASPVAKDCTAGRLLDPHEVA